MFDKFDRPELLELTLCNPNFDELYVIVPDVLPKITFRFNAMHELTFGIDSVDVNGDAVPYFDLITKNRLVLIDGFGYLVIDSVVVTSEGDIEQKEVHCFSYEYMLTMRNADIPAGTYKLYDLDPAEQDKTLLGMICNRCPSWKVGSVSSELMGKYRTFESPDTAIYSFLTQEVSEAYEAIFLFDPASLEIHAFTVEDAIKETGMVFTWDNLMKSAEIAETDDPVITALDVYGAGNLSIASINPLGTPTLYRFDYFAEQMTPALWTKVEAWQNEIEAQIAAGDDGDSTSYRSLLARKLELSNDLITINSEIADGMAMLDSGKQVQDVSTPYTMAEASNTAVGDIKTWIGNLSFDQIREMILNATSYPVIDFSNPAEDIAASVANVGTDDVGIGEALVNIYLCEKFVATANQNKASIMSDITALDESISDINTSLSMAVYFTEDELLELDKFIFGSVYTNEYFVLSENYTFADMQDTARQLYDQGKNAFTRIAQPNYNFSLDAMNFWFLKEYEEYAWWWMLGCTVNAEIREGEWVTPILLEMELDYNDPGNFSMVWGNRYRLQTAEWTWAELNDQVTKTSNTVAANFSDMIKPVRSGELDRFAEFMNSALDTSRNAVLAGNYQAMTIDSHGILGRMALLDTDGNPIEGGYEPEQIKILNNGIYLTDDNWLSCAMAMGKVNVGGMDKFGVVADVLVGSMLIGDNLSVINESGNFKVDGSGMSFEAASTKAKIVMNPTDGFSLQKNDGTEDTPNWQKKISMDMDGNIFISGELISIPDVEVDTVGGWDNEDESGLQKVETSSFARLGGNTYAFSAGTISSSAETAKFSVDYTGALVATDATITGKITATSGAIGGWNISGNNLVSSNGSISAGSNFSVSSSGVLTAKSGSIGGFTINSNSLVGTYIGLYPSVYGGQLVINGCTLTGTNELSVNTNVAASGFYSDYSISAGTYIQAGSIFNYGSTDTWTLRWASSAGGYIGYSSSTIRHKEDVSDMGDEYIDIVNDLRPRRFKWKADGSEGIGLIAEEVEKVYPPMVIHESINGVSVPGGVDYEGTLPKLLLPYVQKLNERLTKVEEKIDGII